MLGVPFDKVTTGDTLNRIRAMIESGRPHYAATANVDFTVQALGDVELRRILAEADLVLCDGMPLVWASGILGNALPERVAGSDLVPELLAEAEREGWRVYFLGGTDDSLARAAEKVRAKHPNLQLVGTYSPPFSPLLDMDQDAILQRIHAARPDILLVAFGCPKQEKWINMNYRRTGVPFSIGVGATIDFLAGSVRRAPRWMQRSGLEWIFRLLQEPRRLVRRYITDLGVFSHAIVRQWWSLRRNNTDLQPPSTTPKPPVDLGDLLLLQLTGNLDTAAIAQNCDLWTSLIAGGRPIAIDLSGVGFVDSTGAGLLLSLNKQARAHGRHLVLVAPAAPVLDALRLMRVEGFFNIVPDLAAVRILLQERTGETNVISRSGPNGTPEMLAWQGDITAETEEVVWRMTLEALDQAHRHSPSVEIHLGRVRFIDSSGVRAMVRLRKDARRRGIHLRFTEVPPAVANVLRILRLEQHLLS
jgi:N-acetylglucosaminyldiphosphoundecaprenol N-acetyl-beta-D-mannosaminyltransferase